MFSLSKICSSLLVFHLKFGKCSLFKKHLFKIIFALGIWENVRVSFTFSSARHIKPRTIYRDGYARSWKVGGPWFDPSVEQSFLWFFTALREWAGPAGDAPVRGNVFMLHCRATVIVPASLPMGRPSRGLSPVRRVEIGRNARRLGASYGSYISH